jgi:hypothetical protein
VKQEQQQNTTDMKYEATYEELSKIFGMIAKAEQLANTHTDASREYDNASNAYAENGFKAEDAERMHIAYDYREATRKALRRNFKTLIELMEINENDYSEDQVLIEHSKRLYCPAYFIMAIKRRAVELAKSPVEIFC